MGMANTNCIAGVIDSPTSAPLVGAMGDEGCGEVTMAVRTTKFEKRGKPQQIWATPGTGFVVG